MQDHPTTIILMYFVLPLWLAAGFADWLCHRATSIETTSGLKESGLHLLQFGEIGLAMLAGIFLEINAGVIAFMILVFLLHEATAWWDVSYSVELRNVSPAEQHVHSFLEMLPLLALVCIVDLHWDQFQALLGLGEHGAEFALAWKEVPLPPSYVLGLGACVVVFVLGPFAEEFLRCMRADRRA